MDEYKVFLVLVEIAGFFFLVGKPIIELNKTISTLIAEMKSIRETQKSQKDAFESFTEDSKQEHKDFHTHLEGHELKLADHEHRIKRLEENN